MVRRCLKRTKGKHCYIALLLGSVLANVVQLLAFFLNQPNGRLTALPVLHHARTSYRKLVGHLTSKFSSSSSAQGMPVDVLRRMPWSLLSSHPWAHLRW